MPEEFSRTTARKEIQLPSGDKINIPVITKISFIDSTDRYQESEYTIDNTSTSDRAVHVDALHPTEVDKNGVPINTSNPDQNLNETLYVERIDVWPVVDPVDRGQETRNNLDNITGKDAKPPHFNTHLTTHIYRYYKDPQNPSDEDVWVDSELIDEFATVDPVDRGQETRFKLNNPTNEEFRNGDLSGQASLTDPDISERLEGAVDSPVRVDPFQNIVNWNGGYLVMVVWVWSDVTTQGHQYVPEGHSQPPSSAESGIVIPNDMDTDMPAPVGGSKLYDSHKIATHLTKSTYSQTLWGTGDQYHPDLQEPAGFVDYNDYLHSYVFSVGLADLPVTIAGLGDGSAPGPTSATPNLASTPQPGWVIYIFPKANHVVYEHDPTFPVRMTDDHGTILDLNDPASSTVVAGAIFVASRSAIRAVVGPDDSSIITGPYHDGNFLFRISMEPYNGAGDKQKMVWPVTPPKAADLPGGIDVSVTTFNVWDKLAAFARIPDGPTKHYFGSPPYPP